MDQLGVIIAALGLILTAVTLAVNLLTRLAVSKLNESILAVRLEMANVELRLTKWADEKFVTKETCEQLHGASERRIDLIQPGGGD